MNCSVGRRELPEERRPGVREAWNEAETRLGLWVRGELLLMTAIGVASGVVYTALGLPSPLLLKLPIGDISLSWAWPLDPTDGDSRTGRLHFNVGLMF